MIDFELPEELELIRATARDFAADHLRSQERESERERGLPEEVHVLFREIGLSHLELPESLGGSGLGSLARAVVLEELAAADAGAALALDPLGAAFYALVELGGPLELERFVAPLLAEPGARAVLTWDGPRRLTVSGGRLSGELPWVPADRVDLLVVLQPGRLLVVREGIELSRLRGSGLRAAGASAIRLDRAVVAARLEGREAVHRALARARLYTAALLVGVMRAAAEFSREYAMHRVAFGRPIAHHQALAFLIADMASALDGARLLLHGAACQRDRDDDAAESAATAFLEAAEQALFVTPAAVQILGGHGFMQDYPVEKYMRDARTLSLQLGGIDAAREEAGLELARRADASGASAELRVAL